MITPTSFRVAALIFSAPLLSAMGPAGIEIAPGERPGLPPPAEIPEASVETVAQLTGATGGVAVGQDGAIYVADIGLAPERRGETVWRVTPDGQTSVFATGLLGPSGNAFDSSGNLFQSNLRSGRISRITPEGTVSTFAAAGIAGPVGVVVDDSDALYVADCGSNSVVHVGPTGTTSTYATSPLFSCPNGITIGPRGEVYVANFDDGRLLRVSVDREVTVFATLPGGNLGHVTFGNGVLYVVARGAHQLYSVGLDGDVTLLAGTGARGHADGPALQATFSLPNDVAISPDGTSLYVNEVASVTENINRPSVLRRIVLDATGR